MNLSVLIPSKDEPKILKMIEAVERCFPNAQIVICNDRYGMGKGWAVRKALEQATGDYICFIDGDLDIHPSMIHRLIPFLSDYDIVIGKKQIRRSIGRRILTKLTRFYLHLFFGLNYDTQTGIKLFHRYALLDWKTNSFIFDLEILAKARNKGLQIIEVPVEVNDFGSSSKPMKISSILKCLKESFNLWLELR